MPYRSNSSSGEAQLARDLDDGAQTRLAGDLEAGLHGLASARYAARRLRAWPAMIGWPVCCQRAARIRCSSRTAFVTGPTPPGTGVIAAATLAALVEVDVAHDPPVAHVDADVDDQRARMEHVRR